MMTMTSLEVFNKKSAAKEKIRDYFCDKITKDTNMKDEIAYLKYILDISAIIDEVFYE